MVSNWMLWWRSPAARVAAATWLLAAPAHAAAAAPDLTNRWAGYASLAVFVLAYALVIGEERLHLRKSISVLIAAGLIWLVIGVAFAGAGVPDAAATAIRHNLLEFGELFLFLLAAMTFINTMQDRGVFDAVRAWLTGRGFTLRQLFWLTGLLAFCLSPVADNLTTALVMGAVVQAVGAGHPAFVAAACVNVVVAANAGGVFSPFGDITTLMVWQRGHVGFFGFFALALPALANWLVPAVIMSMAIEHARPEARAEAATIEPGAWTVVAMFVGTIVFTVITHQYLHLPPAIGMMTGLGVLKLYGYALQNGHHAHGMADIFAHARLRQHPLDTFRQVERAEWDTLLFFYGVIMCVGGLGAAGYLAFASHHLYGALGQTWTNVLIGLLSAVFDNIPLMFAVLEIAPDMSRGQWLLITLTAGVGGSLLSIGSAAGVALMGQARGLYTFMAHLRWSWAIALGYAAGIGLHLVLNRHLF